MSTPMWTIGLSIAGAPTHRQVIGLTEDEARELARPAQRLNNYHVVIVPEARYIEVQDHSEAHVDA